MYVFPLCIMYACMCVFYLVVYVFISYFILSKFVRGSFLPNLRGGELEVHAYILHRHIFKYRFRRARVVKLLTANRLTVSMRKYCSEIA